MKSALRYFIIDCNSVNERQSGVGFVVGLLHTYFVSPGQADRHNARDRNGDRSSSAKSRQGIENFTFCLFSRVN